MSRAQSSPSETAQQLFQQERWTDVVQVLGKVQDRQAEQDFEYGVALAHLERWTEARQSLVAGAQLAPDDKRFPIELAGVAFREKRYSAATIHLRRALLIDPHDEYANEFLATVYFLQGNNEAAVHYWNRLPQPKPTLAGIRNEPKLKVRPALLDHALAFSPTSVLTVKELRETEARLRNLEIFHGYRLDLFSSGDDRFDAVVRAQELNGFGNTRLEALVRTFSGLPNQEVTPEYYNLGGRAINIISGLRWDPDKRRGRIALSGPLGLRSADPRWRFRLNVDLRNENWEIRNGFTGPAPVQESLNLRKEAYAAEISRVIGWRWKWTLGAEVSNRDLRNVVPGSVPGGVLTPQLLAQGYQLKQTAVIEYQLWRSAERRIRIAAQVRSQAGRMWSTPDQSFEKLEESFEVHWLPHIRGEDYQTWWHARYGRTFGQVPFDELFMLGLGADNGLLMRAHVGTRHGRKGSAPLGRNYFLSNWETDKNLYSNGIVSVKLGPFIDTGKITDPAGQLGQRLWLVDTGAQVKLRVLGVSVVFSYGKDLRTGNNEFYAIIGR
jgi:tetratricopeptide (TPR) repeat protein